MLNEYAGRIVAFIVTPIITSLTAVIVVWASKHLPGVELDSQEISNIAVAAVVAVGAAGYKWLENRGRHEQLVTINSQQGAVGAGDPVVPPGLQNDE
jgi:hypothetical protein